MIKIEKLKGVDTEPTIIAVTLPMDDPIGGKVSQKGTEERIELLSRLVKAGPEHAKAVRGIWAHLKITAPRYWWSEFDTYKIGVQTLSSTSTMHKITSRDLIKGDFAKIRWDYLNIINTVRNNPSLDNRQKLIEMKMMLPESYLQTRVVQINYQALRNIYFQRKAHRLKEWRDFCEEIEKMELSKELITIK